MSTNRREFLGAAAGVVFTGCSLVPEAHAQRARRPVSVAGKPIKTVDVHAHCVIPEALALMGQKVAPVYAHSYAERMKRMDEMGIDVQALSINPSWYALERDLVEKAIDLQNEKLAEICANEPSRFVAFASVALQYPDLAARQLEQAVKKLNLRGAAIGGSVEGMELSDPKLHPFWQKAEELGCLVFIHPQRTKDLDERLKGNGGLDNTIWNPLETTLALSHLIYEGTLDRFPGLKICGAHGGGYLPSYADRSDHICGRGSGADCRALKKKPSEYFKRELFVDTMVFHEEGLRHLIAEVGISQILYGTDYPFDWP